MEVDKVALGHIFSPTFHFSLTGYCSNSSLIWPVWSGMPQLSCGAEGLSHTLPVHLHKIIDLNWKAKCINGVHCLSMRGHVVQLLEGSVCENFLNHQLVIEI
jgi:hypothetical protein